MGRGRERESLFWYRLSLSASRCKSSSYFVEESRRLNKEEKEKEGVEAPNAEATRPPPHPTSTFNDILTVILLFLLVLLRTILRRTKVTDSKICNFQFNFVE